MTGCCQLFLQKCGQPIIFIHQRLAPINCVVGSNELRRLEWRLGTDEEAFAAYQLMQSEFPVDRLELRWLDQPAMRHAHGM